MRPAGVINGLVLPRIASLLVLVAACASAPPAPPQPAPPSHDHHHEQNLPPVGPQVTVTLDGKRADVAVAELPQGATLAQLFKTAFPSEDPAILHFDLFGSDGFHPAARPACARLLTGAEVAAAQLDPATHNVSFDDALKLPGCYRVKALVRIDATR
jgi:hypothetical protein